MAYQWWKFLHLAGAFGFLIAHGASVAVSFRLRRERDRSRIAALLELSSRSLIGFYISLLLLVGAGVVLGFLTAAWGRGWIWTAIAVLVLVSGAMGAIASTYFQRVRNAVTARRGEDYLISDEELEDILSSGRPWLVAIVGYAGLGALLWLMVFRPF